MFTEKAQDQIHSVKKSKNKKPLSGNICLEIREWSGLAR
jgi:hypothetical protein